MARGLPPDIIANATPDKWIDPDSKYSGILVDEKNYQGNDTEYADKATFAYYTGHGNVGELSFSNLSFEKSSNYDLHTWFIHLMSDSIYLGNTNARYVTYDSCLTLNESGTRSDGSAWNWDGWKPSFGPKLRMMLGFDTESRISQHRGIYFAERMTGVLNDPGDNYKGKVSIEQAWWDAADLTEPADHRPAIIYKCGNNNCTNDDNLPILADWSYSDLGSTPKFYYASHTVPGVDPT